MVSNNRFIGDGIISSTATDSLEVHNELAGLKAGVVEVADIQLTGLDAGLSQEIDATCDQLSRQHSVDSLRQWEPIRAVRKMFADWRMDPSKYRPSSEALLRRVIKSKILPRISKIVDIGNLGAIEVGLPHGCYDRTKLSGPIQIRYGKRGEQYEGIGRSSLRLEGRPVFSDVHGPFGSPVSDSTRTMVTESTRELLVIICAPESSSDSMLDDAMTRMIERLVLWCGASGIRKEIVNSRSNGRSRYSGTRELVYAPVQEIAITQEQNLTSRLPAVTEAD